MVNKKLVFAVLLFALQFSEAYTAFNPASDGCDGCKRDAVLKKVTGLEKSSFLSRLVERATSKCFLLKYNSTTSIGKPPEYYFTAAYEADLPGKIKSRLNIILYFEDGAFIHNWKTESERPTVTFNWHLNNMFNNPDAVFMQSVPLKLTLLNDFEKQPSKCDIKPDKEEIFPGQEIQVKLSNIVDFEGRKSREFNRIVVQAVDGVIIGGTPLASDPDLMAFQVGKEDITFTYVAPDDENSQAAGDKIVIYNSCDILRKDEYPMPKTGLKDKIAEKKIKLIHADAMMTISQEVVQILDGAEINWKAKENVVLKYTDALSDEDEGTFTEYYDVISWKLTNIKATKRDTEKGLKEETKQAKKDDDGTPSLSITFDSKTGKAKEIEVPVLSFWFLFHDKINSTLPGFTTGFFTDIKEGDGNHTIEGGGIEVVGSVTYKEKWSIKRHKK